MVTKTENSRPGCANGRQGTAHGSKNDWCRRLLTFTQKKSYSSTLCEALRSLRNISEEVHRCRMIVLWSSLNNCKMSYFFWIGKQKRWNLSLPSAAELQLFSANRRGQRVNVMEQKCQFGGEMADNSWNGKPWGFCHRHSLTIWCQKESLLVSLMHFASIFVNKTGMTKTLNVSRVLFYARNWAQSCLPLELGERGPAHATQVYWDVFHVL